MKLVIFGPPGSGKGTYSSRLENRIDVKHIATGDILREVMKRDTELSNKVSEYVDEGKLVPDDLMNKVVEKKLKEIEMDNFILDGYPRNINQAKFLNSTVDLDALILLNVTNEIIIERLSSRRICKDCGEVFNKLFLPPKEEGVCDKCDGDLYQREDDKPEGIKTRIQRYEEKEEPVIDYFKGKIPVVVLKCRQADAPADEMVDKIIEKLKERDLIS